MTLIEHMERTLGPITGGWAKDASGQQLPFQVVDFEGGPIAGTRTVATLGVSNRALPQPSGHVRLELVMLYRTEDGYQNYPQLLQQVATAALADNRAYLRGDVIGPRGPLHEGSRFEALYVSAPAYFPDAFHTYPHPSGEDIVFAWLVPITRSEALRVHETGWEAFEEALVRQDPDLVDPRRQAVA